jgi:hypothetical protein
LKQSTPQHGVIRIKNGGLPRGDGKLILVKHQMATVGALALMVVVGRGQWG